MLRLVKRGEVGVTSFSCPTYPYTVRIWRDGWADLRGAEFLYGNHSREYDLGARVPASLVFHCDTFDLRGERVGGSLGQDPTDSWPYAMTKPGTWVRDRLLAVRIGL